MQDMMASVSHTCQLMGMKSNVGLKQIFSVILDGIWYTARILTYIQAFTD